MLSHIFVSSVDGLSNCVSSNVSVSKTVFIIFIHIDQRRGNIPLTPRQGKSVLYTRTWHSSSLTLHITDMDVKFVPRFTVCSALLP